MDYNLLMIPGVALTRAVCGWAENSLEDGKISFPEWKQLSATIIRMGVPMIALIYGLNIDTSISAGLTILFDIVITKIQSSLKKKKK